MAENKNTNENASNATFYANDEAITSTELVVGTTVKWTQSNEDVTFTASTGWSYTYTKKGTLNSVTLNGDEWPEGENVTISRDVDGYAVTLAEEYTYTYKIIQRYNGVETDLTGTVTTAYDHSYGFAIATIDIYNPEIMFWDGDDPGDWLIVYNYAAEIGKKVTDIYLNSLSTGGVDVSMTKWSDPTTVEIYPGGAFNGFTIYIDIDDDTRTFTIESTI